MGEESERSRKDEVFEKGREGSRAGGEGEEEHDVERVGGNKDKEDEEEEEKDGGGGDDDDDEEDEEVEGVEEESPCGTSLGTYCTRYSEE